MPSSLAWLDTSAREMNQAREIIKIFEGKEGRDELGLGTIRDALSNLLFPGTSVLQTRARYYVFIPWIYQIAAERSRTPRDFDEIVKRLEGDLVEQLQADAAGLGIIGGRAGREVRNRASALYWNGMRSYGIVRAARPHDIMRPSTVDDLATELANRNRSTLAELPPRPKGFPRSTAGGFSMSQAEAQWLRERIVTNHRDTPLAVLLDPEHLDAQRIQSLVNCGKAWLHPDLAPDERVEQARRFSRTMMGAALLYNLMLGEACAANGFTEKGALTDDHRERLHIWQEEFAKDEGLRTWEPSQLWAILPSTAIIPLAARQFVESWVQGAQVDIDAKREIADDGGLRTLITERERRKGAQARLANPRMLETWSGEAGTGGYTFRWSNVRGLVVDIMQGVLG